MHISLRLLLPLLLLATPFSWSQEESPGAPSADQAGAEDTKPVTDDDSSIDTEIDDKDLDEQVYEDDDDDFVPTEEIPADTPIPFPSNI